MAAVRALPPDIAGRSQEPGSPIGRAAVEGNLARSVIEAQEVERRRIATDLHDVVGQALTVVRLSVLAARHGTDRATIDARLDHSLAIIELALDQVRGLARDLRPSVLDDLGLVAAIRGYLDRQASLAGFTPRLHVRAVRGRLSRDLETACFRIVQEAVTNVIRHAAASSVEVVLVERGRTIEVHVTDDGRGFDVLDALRRNASGERLGLVGMQQRAQLLGGRVEFRSTVGRGSEVRAILPLARGRGFADAT